MVIITVCTKECAYYRLNEVAEWKQYFIVEGLKEMFMEICFTDLGHDEVCYIFVFCAENMQIIYSSMYI